MKKLKKRSMKHVNTVEKYACNCGCGCLWGINDSSTRLDARNRATKL